MNHQGGNKSKYQQRPKDSDDLLAEWIDEAEQSFYATGNPCFIVSALGLSAEIGWYPPDWVLDYLVEKFEQFDKDQFQSNLNVLLGFSRGRGRDDAYSTQIIAERDEYIMGEIFDLRQQSSISIKKAAQAVADYYSDQGLPFPYDDVTKKPLSAATLESRYKKEKWDQRFKEMERLHPPMSAAVRARYLAVFGITTQPEDTAVSDAMEAFLYKRLV